MIEKLPNFIIVGQEDWDEIWRRNQFLIAGLARRFPDSKFLFVEPPFDLTYAIRSRQLFRSWSPMRRKWNELFAGLRNCEAAPNIKLFTIPKVFPNGWSWGKRVNSLIASFLIKSVSRRWKIKCPIFWTQDPLSASLSQKLDTLAVIYDNTDNWTTAGFNEKTKLQLVAGDTYFAKHANLVLTCSALLTAQKKAMGANVAYIRNGVDAELYSSAQKNCLSQEEFDALPRPILGYTGSLHERRLDIDLIQTVASEHQMWSFVFVGPNFLSSEDTKRLLKNPNVYLFGSRAYNKLPQLINELDILILPHKVNDFTESLDPIKIYEYLASGKPIIATSVAGVREHKKFVNIIHNASEFDQAVEAALTESTAMPKIRREIANEYDWKHRVDELVNSLDIVLKNKSLQK